MQIREPILEAFVDESGQLLQSLERAALPGGEEDTLEERAAEIERVLHTIKGNAGALGYGEFASAASDLLDKVREVQQTNEGRWFAERGGVLLWNFVTRSREYLRRIADASAPKEGFFAGLPGDAGMDDSRDEGGSGPRPAGRAVGGGENVADGRGEAEIAEILASAPPINPRIKEIVELAKRELERERSGISGGFCPDDSILPSRPEAPRPAPKVVDAAGSGGERPQPEAEGPASEPPPVAPAGSGDTSGAADGPQEIERQGFERSDVAIASLVNGYALEAAWLHESARQVLQGGHRDKRAAPLLKRIADFLDNFACRSAEPALVPASEAILAGADSPSPSAGRLRGRLDVEAAEPEARIPPGLGCLVCDFLGQVCEALLAVGSGSLERVLVHVERCAKDRLIFSVLGLPKVRKTTIRLRMFPIRKRVDELGGCIRQARQSGAIALELPDNFRSVDVLLLRSGDTEIGLPGHRVVGILDARSAERGSSKKSKSIVFQGDEIDVVDLTGTGVDKSDDGPDGCIVVLKGDHKFQGVMADEIVERREMLVQVNPDSESQSDVLGFCVHPEDWSRVPLLAASLNC